MFLELLSTCIAECLAGSLSQQGQTRPTILNINYNEALFYPFVISANKRDVSCNTIDYTYAQECVPDKIKNMKIKVFNLMSRVIKQDF